MKYQAITSAFKEQEDAKRLSRDKAIEFCNNMRNAIQVYFDLPEFWNDVDEKKPYVWFAKAEFDEEGELVFNEFGNAYSCLTINEKGHWIIGVTLTCELGENSFPKRKLITTIEFVVSNIVKCRFFRQNNNVYEITHENDFGNFMKSYNEILLDYFSKRFPTDFTNGQSKIGFIVEPNLKETKA